MVRSRDPRKAPRLNPWAKPGKKALSLRAPTAEDAPFHLVAGCVEYATDPAFRDGAAKDFEEPRAKNSRFRPGVVPGDLSLQVDAVHVADARLHRRRKSGRLVGCDLRPGLPRGRPRTLRPPPRAVGGGRGLLDGRRGRQAPVQTRPPPYLRHRNIPAHKDALLELLPLRPLGHRRRRGFDPLGRIPLLRRRTHLLGLPRRLLPRLPRRPLPVRRARRHLYRDRDRSHRPGLGLTEALVQEPSLSKPPDREVPA